MVNNEIPKPIPPGPWVNEFRCKCGDHLAEYSKTSQGVTWDEGVQRLRETNADIEGKGYRSRGPVLWAMRVIKLERWYADHVNCNTCEIVERWPTWWSKQEAKARDEGYTGRWQWCEDDDDDDDYDDDDADDDDDDDEEDLIPF